MAKISKFEHAWSQFTHSISDVTRSLSNLSSLLEKHRDLLPYSRGGPAGQPTAMQDSTLPCQH